MYRPIKLVGRAFTVDSPPRDNSILRRAVQEATRGDVLVVHRGGDDDGVLIIPASQVETVIERGLEAGRREQDTRRSFLAIAAVIFLGTGLVKLVVIIGVLYLPTARLAYASSLAVVQPDYLDAARALGGSTWRLMRRHVPPNIASPSSCSARCLLDSLSSSNLG